MQQERQNAGRSRILIADTFAPEGAAILEAGAEVDVKLGLSEDELAAALLAGEYDALVVRSDSRVTERVLRASASLRVVARAGVGVDNIDVPAATRHGVLVLNMPTGNTVTTAEHTMTMLCSCARSLPQANAAMRDGRWDRSKFLGMELSGKTLGIVGLGRVGGEVARRAQGFAMRVIAYDPYISPERAERLHVSMTDSLEELLPQADILTVHTPLNSETRHIIDGRALANLPRGARVINCARGGIVDEAALVASINDGHIEGAAVDVFVGEPIKDASHPLVSHPKIITTPHLGSQTREAELKVALGTARDTLTALAGEPVAGAVNAPPAQAGTNDIAPYIKLASLLGQLAVQWDRGPVATVQVAVAGELASLETEPLASATLAGILSTITDRRVNLVNARLVADERGIQVEELRSTHETAEGYRGALSVRLQRDETHFVSLSGSVISGTLRLLSINGYRVDLPLESGDWLITRHTDQPGIIGAVGMMLGRAGINIGFMQLGRDVPHGEALMVVGVDSSVPDAVLAELGELEAVESARRLHIEVQ